jgi:hypothetical protein
MSSAKMKEMGNKYGISIKKLNERNHFGHRDLNEG